MAKDKVETPQQEAPAASVASTDSRAIRLHSPHRTYRLQLRAGSVEYRGPGGRQEVWTEGVWCLFEDHHAEVTPSMMRKIGRTREETLADLRRRSGYGTDFICLDDVPGSKS